MRIGKESKQMTKSMTSSILSLKERRLKSRSIGTLFT